MLELLVVLTLIAILSAGATLQLGSAYQTARFDHIVDEICFLDRQVRDYCHRYRRTAALKFHIDDASISATMGTDQVTKLRMPRGVKIAEVMLPDRSMKQGLSEIYVSPLGQDTYAIQLVGHNEQMVWLLFSGITGQVTTLGSRSEVEDVFETIRPQRIDID